MGVGAEWAGGPEAAVNARTNVHSVRPAAKAQGSGERESEDEREGEGAEEVLAAGAGPEAAQEEREEVPAGADGMGGDESEPQHAQAEE